MGKRGDSVIGIDLGKHAFKAVTLRRKSDSRLVLTSFASREVPDTFDTPQTMAEELKLLLRELGNGSKNCAVAVSDPAALIRIIEQPETPIELLRSALRLSGLTVLNQECRDFVLDVTPVNAKPNHQTGAETSAEGSTITAVQNQVLATTKYLVGGMQRETVNKISEAVTKTRLLLQVVQLAPVCSYNAFEVAYPEIFNNEAFLLFDMGHLQSTVLAGSKGELVLVRSIDYGGKVLTDALTAEGAIEKKSVWKMIEQGDQTITEICRNSLARLVTELRNSIGFFEGQREEGINRIFVSGGLARVETVLQTLSDDLGLPCEIWDPIETCEVALPTAKRHALPENFVSLNVACGVAFDYLRD
jgi:Tfp pilus assembly PilM family ATPase